MNKKDIEHLYNYYKKSISTVKKLEIKLLKESYSFEKWSSSLRNKSITIRNMYVENERMISDIIKRCNLEFFLSDDLNESGESREAIADQFITHIDFFVNEGYRDYEIIIPVLKVLIEYFEIKGPKFRLYDSYYFMAVALMEQREFERAIDYFEKSIKLYNDSNDVPELNELYRCFRVMCSYYYRLLCCVCCDDINQKRIREYYDYAKNVWITNPIVNFLTPKKIRAIEQILNAIPIHAVYRAISEGKTINNLLLDILWNEYDLQVEHFKNIQKIDSRLYVTYAKYRYIIGEISKEAYIDLLIKKYKYEQNAISSNFDYGEVDFIALFDDEVADENFAVENLYYMNPSHTYIRYVLCELLNLLKDKSLINLILEDVKRYYASMPIINGNFLVDYGIEDNLKRIFANISDLNITLDVLEVVFVNRQVMTVIHSFMVSNIASSIAERIIDNKPEILVGILGLNDRESIIENKDNILEYVFQAGKCHDIGKIRCSDIINLQSRRINDEEFATIRKHVEVGASLLDCIPSLKIFKEIALGHHKFYDGSKGYPEKFDNTNSSIKAIIDLITIADCIDAATDGLGRNYALTKDFFVVLEELVQDAGVRYSPDIVNYISSDKELVDELMKLTQIERENVYYEIFHDYVEPDVKFRPKDEKYIRFIRESDYEKIDIFRNEISLELDNKLIDYPGIGYVLIDGLGNIYAYSLARQTDNSTIFVDEIVVDKKNRRLGYASLLMEAIEAYAQKEGLIRITLPIVEFEHNDKFAWRNGFVENNDSSLMEKVVIPK